LATCTIFLRRRDPKTVSSVYTSEETEGGSAHVPASEEIEAVGSVLDQRAHPG